MTFKVLRCQPWTEVQWWGWGGWAEGTLNLALVTQLHLGGAENFASVITVEVAATFLRRLSVTWQPCLPLHRYHLLEPS